MDKRLQEKIFNRFPALFLERKSYGILPISPVASRGLEILDGWFGLLWDTLEEIERFNISSGNKYKISQVKQKFGVLTIYVDDGYEDLRDIFSSATKRSSITCETCGGSGKIENIRGYLTVICDPCYIHKA